MVRFEILFWFLFIHLLRCLLFFTILSGTPYHNKNKVSRVILKTRNDQENSTSSGTVSAVLQKTTFLDLFWRTFFISGITYFYAVISTQIFLDHSNFLLKKTMMCTVSHTANNIWLKSYNTIHLVVTYLSPSSNDKNCLSKACQKPTGKCHVSAKKLGCDKQPTKGIYRRRHVFSVKTGICWLNVSTDVCT